MIAVDHAAATAGNNNWLHAHEFTAGRQQRPRAFGGYVIISDARLDRGHGRPETFGCYPGAFTQATDFGIGLDDPDLLQQTAVIQKSYSGHPSLQAFQHALAQRAMPGINTHGLHAVVQGLNQWFQYLADAFPPVSADPGDPGCHHRRPHLDRRHLQKQVLLGNHQGHVNGYFKGAIAGQVKNIRRIGQQQGAKILPGHPIPDTSKSLVELLLRKRTLQPPQL